MTDRRRRALAAAGSVVVGAAVGVFTGLVTGSRSWASVIGFAGAVILWAGLEAWRAASDQGQDQDQGQRHGWAGVSIAQRARVVAGRLTGVRGSARSSDDHGSVTVRQDIGTIGKAGRVTGYDATARPDD